MTTLGYQRYATEFDAETVRFGAAVTGADPDLPVPTCPEWTMYDLVRHVGSGHRWAAEIIEGQLTEPPPYVLVEVSRAPEAWADWLISGARRLIDAVAEAGPGCPVWTWQPDRTAGFWLSKMLHDEVVHRFDADRAAGRTGTVPVDLAVDGISDLLTTIAVLSAADGPHRVFADLAGNGQTLHLRASDDPDGVGWMVQRTADGVVWQHGNGAADTTVRAPARDLLLVLNRRLDPARGRLEIGGDAELFAYWLENSRF